MIKSIIINGRTKLNGKISISGAKNSALKLICASVLLKNETLKITNIPNISDVTTLLSLINYLGGKIILDGNLSNIKDNGKVIIIDNRNLNNYYVPYSIASKMRATFVILGPILARFGKAKVSLPGGCAIGTRPVDIHLDALKQMGAEIKVENGYVVAECKNGKLKGADIDFRFPSVGATENIIMAAGLAEGITRISNVAKEPEIVDLANFLNSMGAKISGAGTPNIEIIGVKDLHSTEYKVMGDRMETATYMIASLLTDGELEISGYKFYEDFGDFLPKIIEIGADIEKINETTIKIRRGKKLNNTNIITGPYPEFPTDLQAPIMTLLASIDGESIIDETIFENRFMHVPELNRMGAEISVMGNRAIINGKNNCYKSANVMSTDLRASVALLCAGLVAEGQTKISRIYHLERGYESLVNKLNNCGADIKVLYDKN